MSDLQQFLAMGGYAFYVWTSYAVAFIVLLANVLFAARGLKVQRLQTRQRAVRARSPAQRQSSATSDAPADAGTDASPTSSAP